VIPNLPNREFLLADNTPCQLCHYSDGDLNAIYALEKRANPHPWSRRNFADSIACRHLCVGVKVQHKWVAQAVFSVAAGDAELLIISVEPAWQGKGIAKKLIECMAEELASVARELFLEVRSSNDRAIQLYESLGFNQLGVRPAYYLSKAGREDAYIYGRTLRYF